MPLTRGEGRGKQAAVVSAWFKVLQEARCSMAAVKNNRGRSLESWGGEAPPLLQVSVWAQALQRVKARSREQQQQLSNDPVQLTQGTTFAACVFFLRTPLRRTPPLCPAERTQTGATSGGKSCDVWDGPHFSTVLPARPWLVYYVGESPSHGTLDSQSSVEMAEGNGLFLFSLHHLDLSGHISCVFTLTAAIVHKIAQKSVTAPERRASCRVAAEEPHIWNSVTQRLCGASIVSGYHGAHMSSTYDITSLNSAAGGVCCCSFHLKTALSFPSSSLSCPSRLSNTHTHTQKDTHKHKQCIVICWHTHVKLFVSFLIDHSFSKLYQALVDIFYIILANDNIHLAHTHTHTHPELQPETLGLAWPHPW